jgi:arsenical pump membrane protein
MNATTITWIIAALATAGVIIRPWRVAEAVWAVTCAMLLIVFGLLSWRDALTGVARGTDVYLFLTGMMLLAELARLEGLFDWLAAKATRWADGSSGRLFLLNYAVGTLVTISLSNDATAVVLTPAVAAAVRTAKAEEPLPYLFACAFIANAASFVLPISNPANLVLYGNHTPALGAWLARFGIASVVSITTTFAMLRWSQREHLEGECASDVPRVELSASGRIALAGIGVAAIVLLTVSALDIPLGLPTAILGALTAAVVLCKERSSPLPLVREISWSVLPLVAGLFVLVEALDHTGVIHSLSGALGTATQHSELATAAASGGIVAVASNFVNNLPAGLIASSTVMQAHSPQRVIDALLIGVDLGPNLSITGSLATILWLNAIRREGEDVSFLRFLKVGAVVMLPALVLSLGARLWLAA